MNRFSLVKSSGIAMNKGHQQQQEHLGRGVGLLPEINIPDKKERKQLRIKKEV